MSDYQNGNFYAQQDRDTDEYHFYTEEPLKWLFLEPVQQEAVAKLVVDGLAARVEKESEAHND